MVTYIALPRIMRVGDGYVADDSRVRSNFAMPAHE